MIHGDRRPFLRRIVEVLRKWQWASGQGVEPEERLKRTHARQISESVWFDAEWYLEVYPDVAEQGMDPARHYLQHGAPEGRDPSPGFSTCGYLARHPHVANAALNPLLHYLNTGPSDTTPDDGPDRRRTKPQVICICSEVGTAGHRFRVVNLIRAVETAGACGQWMTIEQALASLQVIASADLLVLWRIAWDHNVSGIVRVARGSGAAVLFDADDLIIEPRCAVKDIIDGIRTQELSELEVERYYKRALSSFEVADWACCPTEELAAVMRRRGKPTFVLPNGFDDEQHRRSRLAVRRRLTSNGDGLVRIGYAAGTRTHQRDFAEVAGQVSSILRERDNCRLVLFRAAQDGKPLLDVSEFAAFGGLDDRIEWRDFVSPEDLPEEIARFDVNIAPLEVTNPFCEAKSESKFVDAALVEVCTVASSTGPYRRAIRDGESGFLEACGQGWSSTLRRLLDDPVLRRRVARAAYRDVLSKYGPHRRGEHVASILGQILGDERVAARVFAADAHSAPKRPAIALPRREPDVVFQADRLGEAKTTIAIPLFNYRQYVVEALESAAAQTLEALDLVVVDDASTDDSLAVAEIWVRRNAARFNRVLLLHNPVNAGLGPTRNAAFDLSETPFVLALDADNRLLPDACQVLLTEIQEDGAAFVYPLLRQFEQGGNIIGKAAYAPHTLVGGNTIDATAMIRRECWARVGGYADMRPLGWEDFDFWCRMAEHGLWGRRVSKILAEYRVHMASMQSVVTNKKQNVGALVAFMQQQHPWLSLVQSFPDLRRTA